MKSKRFLIAGIGLFFILSIVAAAVFLFWDGGTTVSIYQSGELIDRIQLDTVTTPYSFTIESDNGNYNVVQVEQGRICVADASCPDHVCVKTGWISDSVIPIVCLPNELVSQIESDSSDDIDAAAQ